MNFQEWAKTNIDSIFEVLRIASLALPKVWNIPAYRFQKGDYYVSTLCKQFPLRLMKLDKDYYDMAFMETGELISLKTGDKKILPRPHVNNNNKMTTSTPSTPIGLINSLGKGKPIPAFLGFDHSWVIQRQHLSTAIISEPRIQELHGIKERMHIVGGQIKLKLLINDWDYYQKAPYRYCSTDFLDQLNEEHNRKTINAIDQLHSDIYNANQAALNRAA